MPTPLPQPYVPDYGKTIDAFRTGQQDFLAQKKRQLMQEAGGLAAAGNLTGARNKLYSGGEFDEAYKAGGEMRAQSAEARAAQAHARSLDDAKLAKAGKMQELLGNMARTIKTPEQLEMAKSILKSRGLDASGVTFDQLPMLIQQGMSTQQAYQNEMEERRLRNQEAESLRTQSNIDRSFTNTIEQQQLAQRNKERDFITGQQDKAYDRELKERELAATADFRQLQQRVLLQRAEAAAAKAKAPKPLTEGQATARNFEGMMGLAEKTLSGEGKGVLPSDNAETPMSHTSNSLVLSGPGFIAGALPSWMGGLNKKEQAYMQSAMQFIRAKLRKESGATISPQEFIEEYRNLFPQPGDAAQVRRQKAAARKQVIQGMRIQGGYDAPGAPETGPAPNDPANMSDDELGALFQ